jgi:hypothetical protein
LIFGAGSGSLTHITRLGDAKLLREGQIGTIGSGLVPPLDCSSDGIEDDGEVQNLRVPPAVGHFLPKSLSFVLVEFGDVFEGVGRLCDQGGLAQQRQDVVEPRLFAEGFDILEELLTRNP